MIGFLFWTVVVLVLSVGLYMWRKERQQERWIREQMRKLDWWLREGVDDEK